MQTPGSTSISTAQIPVQQRLIGITGGIATGKSSVGNWLAKRGLPVLDTDVFAREVLAPGTAATRAVAEHFGAELVCKPISSKDSIPNFYELNRKKLGQIVFSEEREKKWLEELVHPLVLKRLKQEIEQLIAEPTIILMIPLLFEVGLEKLCSEIWLVDCSQQQQLNRLLARDRLSESEAKRRIDSQWPMNKKRLFADIIINNDGKPESWIQEVNLLLDHSQ